MQNEKTGPPRGGEDAFALTTADRKLDVARRFDGKGTSLYDALTSVRARKDGIVAALSDDYAASLRARMLFERVDRIVAGSFEIDNDALSLAMRARKLSRGDGSEWYVTAMLIALAIVASGVVAVLLTPLETTALDFALWFAVPVLLAMALWTKLMAVVVGRMSSVRPLKIGEERSICVSISPNDRARIEKDISHIYDYVNMKSKEYGSDTFRCLDDCRKCQMRYSTLVCLLLLLCCCADRILTLRKSASGG